MVGQQFIALLANHPWFKVTWLGASQRSEGKAFRDAAAWRLPSRLPDDVARRVVEAATPGTAPKLVFSGLDSSVAGEIEARLRRGRPHRRQQLAELPDVRATVPLLIPEVNADHLKLLDAQGAAHGWNGRIVTNPNCATVVLAMALAPLRQFGLKTTMITTLQAISGAGYPGVPSWDILGNVIPHIGGGEEEKIETETRKILGSLRRRRGRATIRCASARRRRACRCRTATPDRSRSASSRSRRPKRSSTRGRRSAAGRRSSSCRRRRRSRSSTCTKRTGRSRCSTSIATAG